MKKRHLVNTGKTNPIQTQYEPKTNPIPERPKMNLNFYSAKNYDNKSGLLMTAKQTQPVVSLSNLFQNVERLLALEQIAAIIILIIEF
jgi:hypothetical protein